MARPVWRTPPRSEENIRSIIVRPSIYHSRANGLRPVSRSLCSLRRARRLHPCAAIFLLPLLLLAHRGAAQRAPALPVLLAEAKLAPDLARSFALRSGTERLTLIVKTGGRRALSL